MLYRIKQDGGLKASLMHVWLCMALFSLFNNQKITNKAAKQTIGNLLIV